MVEVEGLHQVHGALQHLIAVGEVAHLVGGQVGHQVQGPAVQGGKEGVGVLIDPVGHPVQVGRRPVVVLVPFQDDVLLDAAGDELEGAGTDGLGGLLFVAGGHDGDAGDIAEEVGVGGVEGDDDLIPLGPQVRDSRKRLYHSGSPRGSGAGFKGIEHVFGGAGLTVVEDHTIPEGEGVGQAILRNAHIGGHGVDIVAGRVGLYQPLEDVEHDLSSSCGRHLIRVKTTFQVLGDAHGDLISVGLAGRRGRFVAGGGRLGRCSSAGAE